jgi:hypothetical protein
MRGRSTAASEAAQIVKFKLTAAIISIVATLIDVVHTVSTNPIRADVNFACVLEGADGLKIVFIHTMIPSDTISNFREMD